MDAEDQPNPPPRVELTREELTELMKAWGEATRLLSEVKAKEMELRQRLFQYFFPNPKEGVNRAPLAGGWQLKADHKINRKLMKEVLPAIFGQLDQGWQEHLINWEPFLKEGPYKKLAIENPEVFKLVQQAVIEKPGAPQLEFVSPKAARQPGGV